MFFLLFRSFEGACCEWFPTFQPSSPKMLCRHGTRHTLVLLTKLLRCYCWQCWAHVRVSCNWMEWLLQKLWVKHWARTRNLHPTWYLLSLKMPWTKRVTEGTCRFVPCFVFTERPMIYWKIELSNEHSFVQWQDLTKFIKKFILHIKKMLSVTCYSTNLLQHKQSKPIWLSKSKQQEW